MKISLLSFLIILLLPFCLYAKSSIIHSENFTNTDLEIFKEMKTPDDAIDIRDVILETDEFEDNKESKALRCNFYFGKSVANTWIQNARVWSNRNRYRTRVAINGQNGYCRGHRIFVSRIRARIEFYGGRHLRTGSRRAFGDNLWFRHRFFARGFYGDYCKRARVWVRSWCQRRYRRH